MIKRNFPLRALKVALYALALFHIIVGVGLVISSPFQINLTTLYGANLFESEQTHYLLRIIGSFAFVLGLMLLLAAWDPLKYKWIVINLIIFFIFRNIQRYIFISEVQALEITAAKNWGTNLLFWFLVAFLSVSLWAAIRHAKENDD